MRLLSKHNYIKSVVTAIFAFFLFTSVNAQVVVSSNMHSWGIMADGNFGMCHFVSVHNTGDVAVCSPQVSVDLSAYPSIIDLSLFDLNGAGFDSSDFDTSASGFSATNLNGNVIDPATSKCIGPDEIIFFRFTVYADPNLWGDSTVYNWSITGEAVHPTLGNQTDSNNLPTEPMYDSDVMLGGALQFFSDGSALISNEVISPNLDGTYDISFRSTIGNYQNFSNNGGAVNTLTYTDDLNILYDIMPLNSVSVSNANGGLLTPNTTYNGGASEIGGISVVPDAILITDGTLTSSEEDFVTVAMNVGPIDLTDRRVKRFTSGRISGLDGLGNTIETGTTRGVDPTGGQSLGPAVACGNGFQFRFGYAADLDLNLAVVNESAASSGTAGNSDLTYELTITANPSNDVNIYRLSAINELSNLFGVDFVSVVGIPSVINVDATSPPLSNTLFDGTTGSGKGSGTDLLNGDSSNLLEPGQAFTIRYTIEVQNTNAPTTYQNSVNVIGDNSLNELISDEVATDSYTVAVNSEISISDASAIEGTPMTFTISTTATLPTDTTFNLTYTDFSSSATDYSGPFQVVLPANTSSVEFQVNAANDGLLESNETFGITLSEPSGGITFSDADAIGTIYDNTVTDFDNDGIGDSSDLDNDNDGILDTDECYSNGSNLGFNAEDNYSGIPPGPGTPIAYSTGVDGVSRYQDGDLNATELNFKGWGRPGDTSVDWSEGQYVLYSNENSHTEHPALVRQSPAGGGFAMLSTDRETITRDLEVVVGERYVLDIWMGIMPAYHENNKDTDGSPGIDADAGTVSNYGGRIRIGTISGGTVPSGYTTMGDQMDDAGNPSTTIPYYEYDVLNDFPNSYSLADFPSSLPAFEPSGNYTNYPTIDPHWFRHTLEFVADQTTATIQFQVVFGWDALVLDELRIIEGTSGCDTDLDGVPDYHDLDSDNDGIFDAVEAGHNQAQSSGTVNGAVGTDGIPDAVQSAPDNGLANYIIAESTDDSDNINDFIDLDADGDGIPDNVEAQTTVGYRPPSGTVDVNGVDSEYTNGLVPTDTDGTDTPDFLDRDSDNDGAEDTFEANIALTGTDSDNDGLDDATDATNDYSDVGGTIDNPLSAPVILPDSDNDATSGGDVDFRDLMNVFSCDDALYLSQHNGSNATTLFNMDSSANPFSIDPIGGNSHGLQYNGMGYNPLDDFIYAIEENSNNLIRISADGLPTTLGAVSGIPVGIMSSGEIDANGNYYVMVDGSDNVIYQIDITSRTATAINLSQNIVINDFAYNVTDDLLYGVMQSGSNEGALISIDPTNGAVVIIGANNGLNEFGAMYGSNTGEIYGNLNSSGFYQFNTQTGERLLLSSSIGATNNDGAHCVTAPISFESDLSITKTDGTTTYRPGQTSTYTIVASNDGPFGVVNAVVTDAVPNGIPNGNVTFTAVASPGSSTTVTGTENGAIDDLVTLPVGGTVTYTVNIFVPNGFSGNLINTANIENPTNNNDPDTTNNEATDINSMESIDTDNDGVADYIDLDDDNDGILDSDEIRQCSVYTRISSSDFGIPANSSNVDSGVIDVSGNYGLAPGSILIEVLNANTNASESFVVSSTEFTEFRISGSVPVKIQANHGSGLIAGTRDQIFDLDNVGYTYSSTLSPGIDSGVNGNEYYVENNTGSQINNGTNFSWRSDDFITRVQFGTTSTNLGNAISIGLCPATDTDSDGILDYLDLDSDNDGIFDVVEAGHGQSHTNGIIDGVPSDFGTNGLFNTLETDDTQAASIIYTVSESTDDSDVIPDFLDLDSDGDGLPDNVEAQTTIGYFLPDGSVDANGVDLNYTSGLNPVNTDTSDTPDYLDLNSDNEGENDTVEANIILTGNDTDNDGLDDATDATSDYSDVGGIIDNPLNAPIILPDVDSDASTGGDVDFRDAQDNRPDNDNDGIPDVVDLDDDNDGILDTDEGCGNLIINGNFEAQDFSSTSEFPNGETEAGGTYIGSNLNTNILYGWSYTENVDGWVGNQSMSWWSQTFARAQRGEQYIDVLGNNANSGGVNNVLTQIIDTEIGEEYTLSFYWGEDIGHSTGAPVSLDVSLLDASNVTLLSQNLTAIAQGPIGGFSGPNTWYRFEQTFTATTTQTTIRFTANPDGTANGAALDDVRVVKNGRCQDTDNDGVIDSFDLDSDNDGILDAEEAGHAQTHTNGIVDGPTGTDGVPNAVQNSPDGEAINYTLVESVDDIDSIPNFLDLDSDGDGIPDNVEAQTTINYIAPSESVDANGVDISYTSGLVPENTDGLDNPDYMDTDSDNEGENDTVEANITLVGIDTDNDGLDDATDSTTDYSDVGGTIDDPLDSPVILPDLDNDATTGGDVDFRDATDDTLIDLDADDDGIIDSVEDLNTDGDNDPSTDPTDSDGDLYPDYLDIDSDNDGIPDNVEAQTTEGYIPPSLVDVNNNGVDDAYEINGVIGLTPVNTDGVDEPDYLDLDSDNDGVPDAIEAHDQNQDGIADTILIGSDKDDDGLDDAYEGSEEIDIDVNDEIDDPLNNLPNTDGDGEVDYRDTDDDGDGIETIDEDMNEDGDYSNDDFDNDGIPDYLDPDQPIIYEEVEVFNAVTPNGDGIHDILTITGLDSRPNNKIQIFNRWGIIVFATESYNTNENAFDGTSQARVTVGQDGNLPVGTYFYILNYEDTDATMKQLSGYLYLN